MKLHKLSTGWLLFELILIILTIQAYSAESKQDPVVKRLYSMYPDAINIKKELIFLTPKQKDRVRKTSGITPETRMFRVYLLHGKGEEVLRHAFLDSHILRTHEEIALFIIRPDGHLDGVEILGFEEPPEYRPSQPWLELFRGRSLTNELALGGDIPNITGATITATTILRRARLILAVWQSIYGGSS